MFCSEIVEVVLEIRAENGNVRTGVCCRWFRLIM